MRLGILASQESYRQHTQPIWDALKDDERESFATDADHVGTPDTWLVASVRDFGAIRLRHGPKALLEHGVGLQFYGPHDLARLNGALIAAPNGLIAERFRSAGLRHIEVVGTPKMDTLVRIPTPTADTVAVSFHWSGITRLRETVLEVYGDALERLNGRVKLIGHAHPRVWAQAERFYTAHGIEPVRDFTEVVRRAFVYCVDHSSTAFEWAALGRPVVLMDRGGTLAVPNPTGLRYAHHGDIGPHATPETLHEVARDALDGDPWHKPEREAATEALFPFLGCSTGHVVDVLRSLA